MKVVINDPPRVVLREDGGIDVTVTFDRNETLVMKSLASDYNMTIEEVIKSTIKQFWF